MADRDLEFILKFRNDAERQMRQADAALKKMGVTAKRSQRSFRSFGRAVAKAGKQVQAAGRRIEEVGAKLTTRLTLPLAAAGFGVVKLGADFEAEMTKLVTQVDLADAQVNEFTEDVLRISSVAARAPRELAEGLFAITSAGQRGGQALETLEGAAKAAAIGLGSTREVALTVVAAMEAFGEQGLTTERALDTLVGTVREGNLVASDLARSLGPVLGVASQVGATFEDVGASIASFSRLGVDARVAVTGLRATFNLLLKATPASEKALESVGTSARKLREDIGRVGLARTLVDLVERFKKLGAAGQEALAQAAPNIRALSSILGTAGAQGEEFIRISDSIVDSTGALAKGFERVQQDAKFQLGLLFVEIQKFGIIISEQVLPPVVRFTKVAIEFIKELQKASPASIKFGVAIAAVLAVLGPLTIAAGFATFAIGSLISVMGTALAVLGGAGLAVGAVVAAFVLFKDEIFELEQGSAALRDVVVAAFEVIGDRLKVVFDSTVTAARLWFDRLREVFNAVDKAFRTLFEGRETEVKGVFDNLVSIALTWADAQINVVRSVGTAFAFMFEATFLIAKNFFPAMRDLFFGFGRAVKGFFSGELSFSEAFKVAFVDAASTLTEGVDELGGIFVDELKRTFGEAPVSQFFKDIGSVAAQNFKDRMIDALPEAVEGIDVPMSKATVEVASSAGKKGANAFNAAFVAGVKDGLKAYLDEIRDTQGQVETLMAESFKKSEDAIVEFLTTGKFAFKDFAKSILNDILRITIRTQILAPLLTGIFGPQGSTGTAGAGGFKDLFFGLGGALGAGGGKATTAATGAAGGLVGQMPTVMAPAGLFKNAQRFQAGGMVDSVPALLSPGERVLSRAQNRAFEEGGAITVVNHFSITSTTGTIDEQSQSQVAAKAAKAIQSARRNM